MEVVLSAGLVPSSTDQGALTAAFETSLREFFASRRPIVDSVGGIFSVAVDRLEEFVLRGGKRIRPAFAWQGWLGAGGDAGGADADGVLQICAALELVQACALIHDDIIDSSRTRRGHPTVHVEFADHHREQGWAGESGQFGDSVAILLGDLALAWADDMTHAAPIAPQVAARVAAVWSAMRTEVLGGQLLDITGEASGDESVEGALRINRYKTAAYTIERPLHIGASLAGADDALIATYRSFGTDVGIAFQLRDDLLGVFGDPDVTGKPSGDDLREGKRTALLAAALAAADATDPARARLLRASVGTELSESELEHIRRVLTELGAVDDIERRITDLTTRALAALDSSTVSEPARSRLREMAVAATARRA